MKRQVKSAVRVKSWIFEYDQYSFELCILILTTALALAMATGG